MLMRERVDDAGRLAAAEMRDQQKDKRHKRKRGGDDDGWKGDDRDRDDDVVDADMRVSQKMGKKKKKN